MPPAATTPQARPSPKWALVRHYQVLFSSDKDKTETNRVWHDGRLAQHTYNGKLILFDEADVELDSIFSSNNAQTLLADNLQLDIESYVVQVQSFLRVSRTDIGALARPRSNQTSPGSINGSTAAQGTLRSSPYPLAKSPAPSKSASEGSPSHRKPRGPISPHTFKPPFKTPLKTPLRKSDTQNDSADSPSKRHKKAGP